MNQKEFQAQDTDTLLREIVQSEIIAAGKAFRDHTIMSAICANMLKLSEYAGADTLLDIRRFVRARKAIYEKKN